MNIEELKVRKHIFEYNQHIHKMNFAYAKLEYFFPLTEEVYRNLSEDIMSYLDQYLYRFSKLQDCLGQKLFKSVLAYKKEEVVNKSVIDIVNRLEQLEYLKDADSWFELRTIRNQLAHDYEDDIDELIKIINNIFAKKEMLHSYYFNILHKLNLN